MPSLARLDKYMVDLGLARSREEAKELIAAGEVSVNGFRQTKSASMVADGARVEVERAGQERWVSRGAHKLLRALEVFPVDPSGMACVDIGASTGGFTQVLLSRGAARVAALDVGYGQLAWELREDERVTVLERTNARYVTTEQIGFSADLLTTDASFISLRLLLPNLTSLVRDGGTMIVLVKPQFEAPRGSAPKGVVRRAEVHTEVLTGMAEFIAGIDGLRLEAADHSPIKGPEGNIEFLFLLRRDGGPNAEIGMSEIVRRAHEYLKG